MSYKVISADDDGGGVATATPTSTGRGYKVISPEAEPSLMDELKTKGAEGWRQGMALTAPLRRIPGDIATKIGDTVLGAVNLPISLGVAKGPKVTRETFMPTAGVQGLLEDVESKFVGNESNVGGVRDTLNHLLSRAANELITPENVPLVVAGGGLPANAMKALGVGVGTQMIGQAGQEAQQQDYEGAALHALLGAAGVGAGLLPERLPPRLQPGDIQSVARTGEVDTMQGRIPPERQLMPPGPPVPPPPREFRGNLRGEVQEVTGMTPGERFNVLRENEPIQEGQIGAGMQEALARSRMRQALAQQGGNRPLPQAEPTTPPVTAPPSVDAQYVAGLKKAVWDPSIPALGGTESYTDLKTGFTVEGIKPGTPPEVIRQRMQQKVTADLRPAVQVGDKVLIGEPGDTHADVLERNGIDPDTIPHSDPRRGFATVNNPNKLITRADAEQMSGIKGTAEAGGLDSQDLPDAAQKRLLRMMGEGEQVAQKGQQNAVPKLRTDELPQTQPSGDIPPVGEEIRTGAEAEGGAQTQDIAAKAQLKFYGGIPIPTVQEPVDTAKFGKEMLGKLVDKVDSTAMKMRDKMEFYDILIYKLRESDDPRAAARLPEIQKLRDDLMRTEPATKKEQKMKFFSGVPIPGVGEVKDTLSFANELWSGFREGRWNKEQMARLLDAAYNRARNPEELEALKKNWVDRLADLSMPDGKPLVAKGTGEPPEGFVARHFMGARVNVNKDVANVFDSLTASSGVRRNPVGRALLTAERGIKHGLLAVDTYHALRIARKTLLLTGDVPRYANKALVEMTPEEMMDAFKNGDVTEKDVDFYRKNYRDAQMLMRSGLNVRQWAERIGADGTYFQKLVEKIQTPVNVGGKFDVNPASRLKQFNSWVFDKLSKSALMQVGLYELARARKAHPEWTEEQLTAHVVRQSNIYLGNMGRQGVLKSATMRDMANIAFLAPQWVEALAQSEARAAKQIGQIPIDLVRGKGLNVDTQAKGIGTGIVAYLVANQIINMATTGHPTWENKEKGHKFDAFIPAFFDKNSNGFWMSPFADVAEISNDYKRYLNKGEGVGGATAKIIQNKLSPLARAEETARTGRNYAGRRLNEEERLTEAGKALIPVPLPLAGLRGDTPGAEQRQLFASGGLKLEPKGRYEDLEGMTFEQRLKKVQEIKAQRGPMDPASKVRAVEESVFRQQERAKDVTSKLSRADQNWMESRKLVVPGFASNIRVGKIDVPLTEDEVKTLTDNVTKGAEQLITKLRTSDTFNRQSNAAQQEVFNGNMRALISVERNKIRMSMGKEADNSGAQKMGATKGKYKILQPE